MRSGAISALTLDLSQFLEVLNLNDVLLAGYDWGARAGYGVAALYPKRVASLVVASAGYATAMSPTEMPYDLAKSYWYEWYVSTTQGEKAYRQDGKRLCKYLWESWSPQWPERDAEFATFGMDEDHKLAGGTAGIWHAFNITSDKIAGVGGWSNEELSRFLKTGVVPGKAYAGGPTAETVMNRLQHLSDDDIQAIVAYLRDVPAQPGDEKQPRFSWGNAAAADGDAGTEGMTQGSGTATGDDLYRSLCSTCHGANGGGSSDGSYPSLTRNSTPGAATPADVVMTILEGVKAGDVAGRQSMAAFGGWLDDGQVAALANYVTVRFGIPTSASPRPMYARCGQERQPARRS